MFSTPLKQTEVRSSHTVQSGPRVDEPKSECDNMSGGDV